MGTWLRRRRREEGKEEKCSRAFCGQIKAKMKKVRGGRKVMKQ